MILLKFILTISIKNKQIYIIKIDIKMNIFGKKEESIRLL